MARARAALFTATAVGLLVATPAFALPKVGTARPSIKLVDAWDRELDLSHLAQPLLVVYEDKDDGNTNALMKDDLAQLDKTSHYRKTVLHIAVVDVTPWDYWPARGIAKNELQKCPKPGARGQATRSAAVAQVGRHLQVAHQCRS
jgi:hypothetical protein